MKLGLQISNFTWPGGPEAIGPTVACVTRAADDAGFDSIWVMDHFFQIRGLGPSEAPMLEGTSALAFMAAHSDRARLGLMVGGIHHQTQPCSVRVRLGLMVGGIHHRQPGLWIKATTTLDILSGGRAWFGIGAAWNEEESAGLGFPMPPLRDRFEMLEECLPMARAMWSGGSGSGESFEGRHYTATRLLNSPQATSPPRVPIMIGGGGAKKALRLVARYVDACNVFREAAHVSHKYSVL